MAPRWGVTGLLEAERRLRCIKGHGRMTTLVVAIDALAEGTRLDRRK